jgi:hypothetical protein
MLAGGIILVVLIPLKAYIDRFFQYEEEKDE